MLSRLKNWDDQESWRQFFDTYWQLIYRVARKAGLRDDEAQDVVQETFLSVAKKMPDFKYDPAQGSFRGWLCQLTHWRVINQFKKRRGEQDDSDALPETAAPLEEIADTSGVSFEESWEQEWQQHILSLAVARVKSQASASQFQIFDLYVNKRLAVAEVSAALGVNAGQVYLAKHRVSSLLKKELKRLESEIL